MAMKSSQTNRYARKITAFFVLISFTLLIIFDPTFTYAEVLQGSSLPSHGTTVVDPITLIGTLELPEELGMIEERFIPPKDPEQKLILFLQSVHTNKDSETHVRELIARFEKEFALPLVLLEGGSGPLDSLFFKSFPDRAIKEGLLKEYVEKGDLSGGEAASILDDASTAEFYGIEDQKLYQANKDAFLAAVDQEKEALSLIKRLESDLIKSAAGKLSGESQTYIKESAAFHADQLDLLGYLKELNDLFEYGQKLELTRRSTHDSAVGRLEVSRGRFTRFHESYPNLAKVLKIEDAQKKVSKTEVDIAASQMIEAFRKGVLPKLAKDEQMEINGLIQMHQIGQFGPGMLVAKMRHLADRKSVV